MSANAPITDAMSIPEILAQYPQTKGVFAKYGLHVEGYKALDYESLFATSRVHQIDLQAILSDLNQAVQ